MVLMKVCQNDLLTIKLFIMTPRLLSCSSICDSEIRNSEGESIGEIKDLMINWKDGSVSYAVLSFGGLLGMGDKLFAVPLEAFDFGTGDPDNVILNVSKESLENAPGFDKDNWPQHHDQQFLDSVYSHYGYTRNNVYHEDIR